MSYILDALKKSDQAHQRDLTPEPPTIPSPAVGKSAQRALWQYIVAFGLLLNLLLLFWWLHPWKMDEEVRLADKFASNPKPEPVITETKQPQEKAMAEQPPAPQTTGTTESNPPQAAAAAHALPDQSAPVPTIPPQAQAELPSAESPAAEQEATVRTASSGSEAEAKAPEPKQTAPSPDMQKPVSEPSAKPQSRSAQTAGAPSTAPQTRSSTSGRKSAESSHAERPGRFSSSSPGSLNGIAASESAPMRGNQADTRDLISDLQSLTASGAASEKTTPTRQPIKYQDLPPSIRAAIPHVSISMLIYSAKPADRHINVNGSRMREGQEVAPGFRVEEITPDGAFFSYRGQRFFKGVMGD